MYSVKSNGRHSGGNKLTVNVWEQYRPQNTINFSDIVEDNTIYDRTANDTTEGIEISGRSSMWSNQGIDLDAVSVDEILSDSIVHEVRHMGQSRHGLNASAISTQSMHEENFRPSEEANSLLNKDEVEWEVEHAQFPSQDKQPTPPVDKANLTQWDVSCAMNDVNNEMSIGKFFLNRCEDVRNIIKIGSPPKEREILGALVSESFLSSDKSIISEHNPPEDNSNIKPTTKMSTSTYVKDHEDCVKNLEQSVASLSTIASHLDEAEVNSPQTILNMLYAKCAKPKLTKANVQLLDENVLSSKSTKMSNEPKKALIQEYAKKQHEYSKHAITDCSQHALIGMSSRILNSTKIQQDKNQWRNQTSGTTEDLDETEHTPSENLLDSDYSLIKDECERFENAKNKRLRSPDNTPTKDSGPTYRKQNVSRKNTENEHAMPKSGRRLRSEAQTPLDDVSSIMLNNLHINSPEHTVTSVRKCATELRPINDMDIRSIDALRHYENRSPDCAKYSLPNYGLHGIRSTLPEVLRTDKRCNSQCSTHSEFTQNDGKFPLKSNTSELVWECVRLRKNVVKSFVIKNTSEKRLNLKVIVIGPGFQITSGADAGLFILQGNECRTISVSFCPTIIGKAIGKIVFKPTKNWLEETERSVHLWAYGGSTTLQLQGIERGPIGSSFLKMGETCSITSTTLRRNFTIYNKGPLNGVAAIFVKPKTNQYFNENHINIEPNKCVIRPDCTANISVSYKLRRKDLEKLKEKSSEVLTIGTLEVIFGSEPNRQRIASMLTRKGIVPSMYKQLDFLVDDFPVATLEHFKDFREHIDNVSDLFGCFKTSEIALTINRTNLDESTNHDVTLMDDSLLFQTLIETPENGKMWTVQPSRLIMNSRSDSQKSITIQSFFKQTQTYQVDTTHKNCLHFSNGSGRIEPNSEVKIGINLNTDMHFPAFRGSIFIYIERDSIEIPITVQSSPFAY